MFKFTAKASVPVQEAGKLSESVFSNLFLVQPCNLTEDKGRRRHSARVTFYICPRLFGLFNQNMACGSDYLVNCNKRHHFDIFGNVLQMFLTAIVHGCFQDAPGTKPVVYFTDCGLKRWTN